MSPATAEALDKIDLEQVFHLEGFLTDLREGVVTNEAKRRVCLLSTDLLSGIYQAVLEEAGPAWGLLLKNCGHAWGKRLAEKLSAEADTLVGTDYMELPPQRYLDFVTRYFSFHGWGVMEIDVSRTHDQGLVEASLSHSVFAETVTEKEDGEMVDSMICGILAALFSHVAEHDLDCIQTQCSTLHESKLSRFIISDRERVEAVEEMVESGASHQDVLEAI